MSELNAAPENNNVPTIDGISDIINAMFTNVQFAGKRISGDDLSRAALSGIESQLNLLAAEINALFNHGVDEYNDLGDRFVQLETTHGLTLAALRSANAQQEQHEAQIAEMRDGCEQIVRDEQRRAQTAINAAEHAAQKWETAYSAQKSQHASLLATVSTQNSELRALKAMEPEKLKKKYFEEKQKNRELSDSNRDLQTKHNQLASAMLSLKKYTADIEARNAVLSEDMTRYREHMNLNDGDHCVKGMKFASPVNPDIIFYPHLFHWSPWVSQSMTGKHDGIRFINNLDFHLQIQNTIGLGTSYKVSEWGMPVGMIPKELEEHWPAGIDQFMDDFVLEQIDILNSHLAERCRWARSIHVSELTDLPAKIRNVLVDNGVTTLAHLGSTYAHQLAKYRGIGDETIKTIMNLCRRMMNEWNKEHGEPDIERKRPEVKQKELNSRIKALTAENLKALNDKFRAA